ncbi:PREDICTED: transmembrane and coiled-coil domain-containing protein 5B-like [Elephantulus edwardii]|uniref:transmembrane and coiled-coil domain-containing protein 5B-like n=1 Tax=Elephantulus edwardii TaxID=28737 RepID=UPI0003F05FE0|nr:PREDICTED: transmembrane and coiled-coil domain-containing protein 5B-like [Elephantulus edwardii]
MEEVGQEPWKDMYNTLEIPKLEVTKQNIEYLNSDLEKDLQRMDEANQVLLKKIQEKEEIIQSLERELTLPLRHEAEEELLNNIITEKEEALRDVELETAKLENNNKILSKKVLELQKKISKRFKKVGLNKETLRQMLTELKERLQKTTELCEKQEEKLIKTESYYQFVHQLCEDQAHYIKKYQEILREMEKEKEMMLLEKEVFKAQNNSSQIVKPGSILVETIQSNMEKTIIKKQRRIFWFRQFQCIVFVVLIFIKLLSCVFFHLHYINPDLLVDILPTVMSRSTLNRLRDFLFPFLTLEVEEILPH